MGRLVQLRHEREPSIKFVVPERGQPTCWVDVMAMHEQSPRTRRRRTAFINYILEPEEQISRSTRADPIQGAERRGHGHARPGLIEAYPNLGDLRRRSCSGTRRTCRSARRGRPLDPDGGRDQGGVAPPRRRRPWRTPFGEQARRASGERSRWFQRAVFLGPGLLYWFVLFVVPVGSGTRTYSFFKRSATGGIDYTFTLDNYVRAMNRSSSRSCSSRSGRCRDTVIALVLGYMVAYFIATRPERWRLPLLVLIVLPFWTNLLIRTYAEPAAQQRGVGEPLAARPRPDRRFAPAAEQRVRDRDRAAVRVPAVDDRPVRVDRAPRSVAARGGRGPGCESGRGVFLVRCSHDAPRRDGRVHLRVRPEPRELRRAGPARRRQVDHGWQPHPEPVLPGARLAVRRDARATGDRGERSCWGSRDGPRGERRLVARGA